MLNLILLEGLLDSTRFLFKLLKLMKKKIIYHKLDYLRYKELLTD